MRPDYDVDLWSALIAAGIACIPMPEYASQSTEDT